MFLETIRDGTNLMSNSRLEKGEKLVSGNKCFKLIMQEDGNLVLRNIYAATRTLFLDLCCSLYTIGQRLV